MNKLIVIEDACIIIDMIDIGLLDVQLKSKIGIITTDLVINEITQLDQKQILDSSSFIQNIEIKSFTEEELMELLDFNDENNSISLQDNSALLTAIKKEGVLLTNDQRFKKITEDKYKIETHGTLWLIEFLIKEKAIGKLEGIEALRLLSRKNTRISKILIQQLINKLLS